MNIVIFQQVEVIKIQKVNTITNASATVFIMFVKDCRNTKHLLNFL